MSNQNTASAHVKTHPELPGYLHIADDQFKPEVLESSEVVLVEFYRNDCSSCRMFETTLNELRRRYDGKFKFVRLNTSLGSYYQKKYDFAGEPTTAIFYQGELQGSVLGASGMDVFEPQLLAVTAKLMTKYNMPPITRSF